MNNDDGLLDNNDASSSVAFSVSSSASSTPRRHTVEPEEHSSSSSSERNGMKLRQRNKVVPTPSDDNSSSKGKKGKEPDSSSSSDSDRESSGGHSENAAMFETPRAPSVPVTAYGLRNYEDKEATFYTTGWVGVFIYALVCAATLYGYVIIQVPDTYKRKNRWMLISGGILLGLGYILLTCYKELLCYLKPNEAAVLYYFGEYIGTIKESGFYTICPFICSFTKYGTKITTVNTNTLKVNDKNGNPIDIAAVVSYQIADVAKTALHLELDKVYSLETLTTHESPEEYVRTQALCGLRMLASRYAYDSIDPNERTLQQSTQELADELRNIIQDRLDNTGVTINEAQINQLSYSTEIAAAMLRRQQASSVIAARTEIVKGAIGLVNEAVEGMEDTVGMVMTDEERTDAVARMLVIMCADSSAGKGGVAVNESDSELESSWDDYNDDTPGLAQACDYNVSLASGFGGIKVILDSAPHGSELVVCLNSGIYSANTSAQLPLNPNRTNAVTLRGEGTDSTTLDLNSHGQLMYTATAGQNVTLEDLTIRDSALGSCVELNSSRLTASRVRFTSNNAGGGLGAAIYCSECDTVIDECVFDGNYGATRGGGIYAHLGSLTVSDALFKDNTATDRGGGVYLSSCSAEFDSVLVEDNSASEGDGVYMDRGSLVLTASLVNANAGTGVYINYASLYLVSSAVTDNGNYGVYSDSADVHDDDSIVCGQTDDVYCSVVSGPLCLESERDCPAACEVFSYCPAFQLAGLPFATSWTSCDAVCAGFEDECSNGTHTCHANATCVDNFDGYVCECESGFVGDGFNCTELVNECADPAVSNCSGPYHTCIDTPHSFICLYDACAAGTHNCDTNAVCVDGGSSFSCFCEEGYYGDGVTCVPACQAPPFSSINTDTCDVCILPTDTVQSDIETAFAGGGGGSSGSGGGGSSGSGGSSPTTPIAWGDTTSTSSWSWRRDPVVNDAGLDAFDVIERTLWRRPTERGTSGDDGGSRGGGGGGGGGGGLRRESENGANGRGGNGGLDHFKFWVVPAKDDGRWDGDGGPGRHASTPLSPFNPLNPPAPRRRGRHTGVRVDELSGLDLVDDMSRKVDKLLASAHSQFRYANNRSPWGARAMRLRGSPQSSPSESETPYTYRLDSYQSGDYHNTGRSGQVGTTVCLGAGNYSGFTGEPTISSGISVPDYGTVRGAGPLTVLDVGNKRAFYLSQKSYVTLANMTVVNAGADAGYGGCVVRTHYGDHITINNIDITRSNGQYGAIYSSYTEAITIRDVTCDRCAGMYNSFIYAFDTVDLRLTRIVASRNTLVDGSLGVISIDSSYGGHSELNKIHIYDTVMPSDGRVLDIGVYYTPKLVATDVLLENNDGYGVYMTGYDHVTLRRFMVEGGRDNQYQIYSTVDLAEGYDVSVCGGVDHSTFCNPSGAICDDVAAAASCVDACATNAYCVDPWFQPTSDVSSECGYCTQQVSDTAYVWLSTTDSLTTEPATPPGNGGSGAISGSSESERKRLSPGAILGIFLGPILLVICAMTIAGGVFFYRDINRASGRGGSSYAPARQTTTDEVDLMNTPTMQLVALQAESLPSRAPVSGKRTEARLDSALPSYADAVGCVKGESSTAYTEWTDGERVKL